MRLIIVLFFISAPIIKAQVGVGTTTPDVSSILDITSSDKGVLVPRINLIDVTNLIAPINAPVEGLLIWNTNASVTGGNGVGFYFFNGVQWMPISQSQVNDADWYEEGGTIPPDDINDNMFTFGNVAIGKNTTTWPLDLESALGGRGMSILMNGTANVTTYGLLSEVTNSADATHVGLFGRILNNGNGEHRGVHTRLNGSGTGIHYGMFNELEGTGIGNQYGIANYVSNTGNGNHYGAYSLLSGLGNGIQYGSYQEITNDGIQDQYGSYNNLTNNSRGSRYGTYNLIGGSDSGGIGTKYGTYNEVSTSDDLSNHVGAYNRVTGNGAGIKYGTFQVLDNSGGNELYATYSEISGTGTALKYGTYNEFAGTSDGTMYGTYNNFSATGFGTIYGTYNNLSSSSTGSRYATYNLISGTDASGVEQYGSYQEMSNSGNGSHYGSFNSLSGSGGGDKYGIYSYVDAAAGGTHYGLYSTVTKAGSYAGYFIGNVSIGTGFGNEYILPPSRGTNGQVMQTDGAGNVSWADGSSVAHRIDDLIDGKSDNDGTQDGSSIFLGIDSGLNDNGSNNQNVGIGFQSLMIPSNASINTAIGYQSLRNTTNGNGNVAIGTRTLITNTTGNYNTVSGVDAMRFNITGDYNSAIGSAALLDNTDGTGNIAIGTAAAGDNTTGNYNTAIGYQSLRQNVTGSYNVALGYQAGLYELGSNRLYIDNSNTANPLIYGEFDNDILRINGRAEITSGADATPIAGSGALEIVGSLRIDGNEIITNTNSPLYLQNDNNGDLRVDATTLTVDASLNRVGIGTVIPSYQLQLTLNSAAKPTSSLWTVASDARLKTDVRPFTDGMDLIKQIKPVWFTYNGKAGMPNETGVGTLAQEFQKIAPFMVKPWEYKDEENGISETYLGIDYGPLTFIIVNAVKEQQDQIEALKIQNDELNAKLEAQQQEIDEIKALLRNQ